MNEIFGQNFLKGYHFNMYDEKRFVIDSFRNNFEKYLKDKIVIYGLGKNTKVILDECNEFNIIGLMDGVRTGETVWDLPVYSCQEVNQNGGKIIIIVATAANVPIIYQRIAKECEKYKITVFDINGQDLKTKNNKYVLPEYYNSLTKETLLAYIKEYEVISFDIFDTLLVRDFLFPTDVFIAVENICADILPKTSSFYENRIKVEQEKYLEGNPNIDEIYIALEEKIGISHEIAEVLKATEIDIESKTLHQRKEMVSVLNSAKQMGKTVCCTSDMYLTKNILSAILGKNDVFGVDNIFVSCEYGASKCDGLFDILKKQYKGKKILHIGDNYDADIVSAHKYNIDGTFKVSSIYQMALDSAFKFILDRCHSYSDRCNLGKLLAEQLNNPFLFSQTNGKGEIMSNYVCGYHFLEPLLEVFTKWLMQRCKEDEIDCLLLGARDGWLIKEILDLENNLGTWKIPHLYFYASRFACTLAGMKNKEDVLYVGEQAFDGTITEKLKKRFLLPDEKIMQYVDGENEELYFDKHISLILDLAESKRKNYRRYIENLSLKGDKIGFFDFVSSGTCQLWLNKIMDRELIGYYVARNVDKYKCGLKISSLYEPKFVYEEQGELYKNFIFLESILTSPEPTLKGFNKNGECVFFEDKRTDDMINHLRDIHRGILDAYKERMKNQLNDSISSEFAESIVSLLCGKYMIWKNSYYEKNELADEFCNRTFDLKQIMKTADEI